MLFKNAQVFYWPIDSRQWPEHFEQKLQDACFKPAAKTQALSSGWVAPSGDQDAVLHHQVMDCHAFTLMQQERLLPASVVREQLSDKLAHIEANEGRKPGKKEKEQLKDELVFSLLPQAFTRSQRIHGLLKDTAPWVLVDQSSAARAEDWVAALTETLALNGIVRPSLAASVSSTMTDWLSTGGLPEGFEFGDRVVLSDPKDTSVGISFKGHELRSDEVLAHLNGGLKVSALQLEWQERLRFVLTDDFSIKQLKWIDSAEAEGSDSDALDAAAQYDAELLLGSNALVALLDALYRHLDVAEQSS